MQKSKRSLRRPAVIFLIGIILIVLSLVFWYFIVPPVVSLGTYSFSRQTDTKTISNGSSLILYFGSINFQEQDYYNRSRPVDYSMNLSLVLGTTGPINVTVYVRDAVVKSFISNATKHNLEFNSTKYTLLANNQTTLPPWLQQDIYSSIPVSLSDAFTGGTTPYMIVRNLNNTKNTVRVTYFYTYNAKFRDSNSNSPILMFIAGVIIAIVYGIVLVRRLIRRTRGS